MATLAQIEKAVKQRITREASPPGLPGDLAKATIAQWANDYTPHVIRTMVDPIHYPGLMVYNELVTFTSGEAPLPADFEQHHALSTAITYNEPTTGNDVTVDARNVRVYTDAALWRIYDEGNFLTTPDNQFPIALITDKIRIKPSDLASARLDYVKKHPTISGSQGTEFSQAGDRLLVLYILWAYWLESEEMEKARGIESEIMGLVSGNK